MLTTIKNIILIAAILIGITVGYLWEDYQHHYNPCERRGEILRLENIVELAPASEFVPAWCAGYRNERWIEFRAR
jgi:hypothetical protein